MEDKGRPEKTSLTGKEKRTWEIRDQETDKESGGNLDDSVDLQGKYNVIAS